MFSSNVKNESNFDNPRREPFHEPKDGKASINRKEKINTSGLRNFREKLFAEWISKNAADLITGARRQGSYHR